MNWQIGTILVVLLACVVPGVFTLIPRKPNRIVKRDRVAERHRAIAKRGFKSRMRNHREYGL